VVLPRGSYDKRISRGARRFRTALLADREGKQSLGEQSDHAPIGQLGSLAQACCEIVSLGARTEAATPSLANGNPHRM